MDSLLPCPFCGGDPDFEKTAKELIDKGYALNFKFTCRNDECPSDAWCQTSADAKTAWNTRVSVPKGVRSALQFIYDITAEELEYTRTGGAECALRHANRKAEEALELINGGK